MYIDYMFVVYLSNFQYIYKHQFYINTGSEILVAP